MTRPWLVEKHCGSDLVHRPHAWPITPDEGGPDAARWFCRGVSVGDVLLLRPDLSD